jgi:hypothetical protein
MNDRLGSAILQLVIDQEDFHERIAARPGNRRAKGMLILGTGH